MATFRRECLDAELFATFEVAQIRAERWRRLYNEVRPQSRNEGRPPVKAYYLIRKAA